VSRFRFVEQEKASYPVRMLCSALGVSPSGYYAWRSRGPSARERSDAELALEIRRSHARSRGTYGVPRVHADLAEAGHHVSRKRVARLMRADHLAGVLAHGNDPVVIADRDDRRFLDDDPPALDIHEDVGRAEVDSDLHELVTDFPSVVGSPEP